MHVHTCGRHPYICMYMYALKHTDIHRHIDIHRHTDIHTHTHR